MPPRPPAPLFTQEEITRIIQPMTQQGTRIVTRDREIPAFTRKRDVILELLQADRFVKALSTQRHPPAFVIEKGFLTPDKQLTELAIHHQHIATILQRNLFEQEEDKVTPQLDPYLHEFHEAFKKLVSNFSNEMRGRSQPSSKDHFLQDYTQKNNEAFEDFLKNIQEPEFKKKVNHARRRANQNRTSMMQYVDGLFERYSSLYVVRLELGYNVGPFRQPSYSRARSDLESLLNKRRNHPLFDDLVGFAWKLEDIDERRYFHHLLLFYDGRHAARHLDSAQALQDYWESVITQGDGACYQDFSSSDKPSESFLPDGLIAREDTAKRQALNALLDYLLKIDRLIHLDRPGGVRMFGKGQLPRV